MEDALEKFKARVIGRNGTQAQAIFDGCLNALKTMDDEERAERARRVQEGRKRAKALANMTPEQQRRYHEKKHAERVGVQCDLKACKEQHAGEGKRDPYACVRHYIRHNGMIDYICSNTNIGITERQEAEGPERLAEKQKRYGDRATAENAWTLEDRDWTPGTYDYPPWFYSHVDQNACYVEGQKTNVPRTPRQQVHHEFMEAIGNDSRLDRYTGYNVQRLLCKLWEDNQDVIQHMKDMKRVIIAAATFYTAKKLGILGWAEPPRPDRQPHPACMMIEGHAPRFGIEDNLMCLKALLKHHIRFAETQPNREQTWLIREMGLEGPPPPASSLKRILWVWRKYVTVRQFQELERRFSNIDAIKTEFRQFEFSPDATNEEKAEKKTKELAKQAKKNNKRKRKQQDRLARQARALARVQRKRAREVTKRLANQRPIYPENMDKFIAKYLPEEWPRDNLLEIQKRWLEKPFPVSSYMVVLEQFKDNLARTYSNFDEIPPEKFPSRVHHGAALTRDEFDKLHAAWELIKQGKRDSNGVEDQRTFNNCLIRHLVENPIPLEQVDPTIQKRYKIALKKKLLRLGTHPDNAPEWIREEYEKMYHPTITHWTKEIFPDYYAEGVQPNNIDIPRFIRADYRRYYASQKRNISRQRRQSEQVQTHSNLNDIAAERKQQQSRERDSMDREARSYMDYERGNHDENSGYVGDLLDRVLQGR